MTHAGLRQFTFYALIFNNKVICDLIEERHRGIIDILDEECLRPGDATDSTFLEKLEETVGQHKHFIT